jgi:hypothetical protein
MVNVNNQDDDQCFHVIDTIFALNRAAFQGLNYWNLAFRQLDKAIDSQCKNPSQCDAGLYRLTGNHCNVP